jgi:hypothetical protein
MGCGVLFALLVIVVALAVTFGPPAFLGSWQEPPIPPIEQPTPAEKSPIEQPTPAEKSPPSPSTPDKKAEQKKKEDTQTVTIRVTGTPGVAFRGAYATGASDSPGVLEGVTPQDFEVEVRTDATEVAAHVANRNEGNEELTLQLLVGGEVVEEKSSTEGWVSV